MPVTRLKRFLDQHDVKYVTLSHAPAYTAQEIAESAHIHGNRLAKVVIVKIDGRMAMAVLPASEKVNTNLLKAAAGARHAELASEAEFRDKFPECELGAMPPFGNLYGMEVFVADTLAAENGEIAFNAGTHRELVKMAYRDFERLVEPRVAKLTQG